MLTNVHEVIAQLNRLAWYRGRRLSNSTRASPPRRLTVSVLDRVFDVADAHRPRTDGAADLDLARARDALLLQLVRRELGRGQQERHLDRVVLRPEEVVPPARIRLRRAPR